MGNDAVISILIVDCVFGDEGSAGQQIIIYLSFLNTVCDQTAPQTHAIAHKPEKTPKIPTFAANLALSIVLPSARCLSGVLQPPLADVSVE